MRAYRTILAVGAVLGCVVQIHAELANGIKAIVHDSIITVEDVEILSESAEKALWRQYRDNPEMLQKKVAEARTDNLEQLLARQLILHDFKNAGYNLPESVIEEMVQERIHGRYGDRMTLTKTLQAEGITYEKFRQQIRDQFIIEVLRQKNVSSEIMISPHKVETYYLAHKDDFKMEDEIKLRMIVLTNSVDSDAPQTMKLAEEIQTKLKDGATFPEMATIYSQGSQRKEGGDWGWVERSVLRKELADVAFTLKPGERSGVIEIPGACYLMLVEETRPAHHKSLGEVRDQIEKNLLLEERSRLEKQWIERLKKKTFVRYF
jgi:peptidyl-prolyl cis-trans isomerase SurA